MSASRFALATIGSLALSLGSIGTANAAVIPTGTLSLLAAGERSSVFAETTDNNTTTHNGSEWYYWEDNSIGFAVEGAAVNLSSADVNDGDEAWSRLSWHIHSVGDVDVQYFIGDGYRLGTNRDLNYDDEEDDTQQSMTTGRFVFTANTLPGYYPSGPQENVPVEDLEGWTLCWSNLYGDDTLELGSLDDVFAACDGEYIMLAGGDRTDGEFADFNGTADDELAETGFDVSVSLGAAATLAAVGIAVVVRRRRA